MEAFCLFTRSKPYFSLSNGFVDNALRINKALLQVAIVTRVHASLPKFCIIQGLGPSHTLVVGNRSGEMNCGVSSCSG